MPEVKVLREPAANPGKHKMTLVSVESFIGPNKFAKKRDEFGNETNEADPDAVREQFVWKFESDEANEYSEPYVYKVFTNTSYGNERAGLTKFLNLLIPALAESGKQEALESMRHFNTDDLVGCRWLFTLRKQQGKNGSYVAHTDVEPLLDANGEQERVLITPAITAAGAPAQQPDEIPV